MLDFFELSSAAAPAGEFGQRKVTRPSLVIGFKLTIIELTCPMTSEYQFHSFVSGTSAIHRWRKPGLLFGSSFDVHWCPTDPVSESRSSLIASDRATDRHHQTILHHVHGRQRPTRPSVLRDLCDGCLNSYHPSQAETK